MEKLDEKEVPEFSNSEEADRWYEAIGDKQKEAFANLLKNQAQKEHPEVKEWL